MSLRQRPIIPTDEGITDDEDDMHSIIRGEGDTFEGFDENMLNWNS